VLVSATAASCSSSSLPSVVMPAVPTTCDGPDLTPVMSAQNLPSPPPQFRTTDPDPFSGMNSAVSNSSHRCVGTTALLEWVSEYTVRAYTTPDSVVS